MKSFLNFTLYFSILFLGEASFAQNCFFAKQMGGNKDNSHKEQGSAIALDTNGNVYTVGQFSDTSDFDPGTGKYTLIASGPNRYGAYVSKLDASGNFVWAIMPTGDAGVTDMAIDKSGNIYVTGYIIGQVDFDPGAGTLLLGSNFVSQNFIWKLNSNGNVVWAKTIGTEIKSIALDSKGDVYLSGKFTGTTDFNPGTGTYNITATKTYETYLAKLTSAGAFSWAFSIGGGPNGFLVEDLATDRNDNIITYTFFEDPSDVDPSANSSIFSNHVILKYSGSGSFIWGQSLEFSPLPSGSHIAVDPSNNIYLGGIFNVPFDADPGSSVYTLTPTGAGTFDVFIIKLNPSGNFLWAQKAGGVGNDSGGPIATDNTGNVYITGYNSANGVDIDLDPGTGTFILPFTTTSFLVKFSSTGNFISAKSLCTASGFEPKGMVIDKSNYIYTTGSFKGFTNPGDFDPDPNNFFLLNTPDGSNQNQIFVCKYPSLTAAVSYTNITCYGANNGTATVTVLDGNSPFSYRLDSLPAGTNNVFTGLTPGSHIITVIDKNSCTQTARSFYISEPTELIVTATTTQESCVGGGSNGTATAVATGGTPSYSYSWNTTPVQTTAKALGIKSGQYIVTVKDKNNCIDTAQVIVTKEYNPSEFTYTINGMVVSFSIKGIGCNTFLWDFGNGNTSSINVAPIVTYATKGTYSACLQCNGQPSSCVTCQNITVPNTTRIENNSYNPKAIKIYPNPSNGNVIIERNSLVIPMIKVFSLLREVVIEIKDFDKSTLDLSSLSKGIYIIELEEGSKRIQQKIIIQ